MIPLVSVLQTIRSLLRLPTFILLLIYLLVDLLAVSAIASISVSLNSQFLLSFILAVIVIAAWYINATALNDYADYEIDMVNLAGDKDRPLVVGLSSRRILMSIGVFAALIAVLCSFLIGTITFSATIILLILNILYSFPPFRVSRRGGFAPALLPLAYIGLPFSLSISILNAAVSISLSVFFGAFYLIFESRILLKDYRDTVGDAKFGKKTFLLTHGNAVTCIISGICLIAGIALLGLIFKGSSPIEMSAIILLSGYGLGFLIQLSQIHMWSHQRGLITSYGRTQTVVLVLCALGFYRKSHSIGVNNEFIIVVGIVIIAILSILKINRLQGSADLK